MEIHIHLSNKGYKAYSKTKPIQLSEFDTLKQWWEFDESGITNCELMKENEQAWKVDIETIKANGQDVNFAIF